MQHKKSIRFTIVFNRYFLFLHFYKLHCSQRVIMKRFESQIRVLFYLLTSSIFMIRKSKFDLISKWIRMGQN
jgi:hypothetical protein